MKMGRRGPRLAVAVAGVAGLAVILALALSGGPQWPAGGPARAVAGQCGTGENLVEMESAVVTLLPDLGPPGSSLEVGLTVFVENPAEDQPVEVIWNWDPDAGEGVLIGSSTIPVNEDSVTVDAAVPEYAEPGSYLVTACWYRGASDTWFYKKSAPFEVTEPTPTPSPTPTPTPPPTAAPTPVPEEQVQNCPQAGMWAIAVWWGPDGTDTGEALGTCGEGAVDAAYALDPDTQNWLRWFADYPQFNTLDEVSNWQGVIAFGKAEPEPSSGPPPSAANEMHNCPGPGQWAIAVWEGGDGIDAGEALGTCAQEVDAAYALESDTQNWLRWFADYPGYNTLLTLREKEGIVALGKPVPKPTATPEVPLVQSAQAGDTEITVWKVSGFAVGDYIQIGVGSVAETCKIVAISGSTLKLDCSLKFDHAAGQQVVKVVPTPTPTPP